jgi:transmembrane sensor
MSRPEPPIPDALFREAASWFARNRSPDADQSRPAFEEWLRTSTLHRRAYARAAEVFAMGKLLADEPASQPREEPRRLRHSRALVAGAAAVALAGGALFFLLSPSQAPAPGAPQIAAANAQDASFQTGPGETRTVRLGDGSVVRLWPSTLLGVHLDATERSLHLRGGAARFSVRHEPRPFRVQAAGGVVTAHGTIFDVAVNRAGVTVHLIEGAVDVVPPAPKGRETPPGRRLQRGETLHFAAADAQQLPMRSSPAEAAVEYEAVRLDALLAAANRGAPHPIRLADPALAGRRVSGRFRTDDTRLLAERLALLLDLKVEVEPSGSIVLRHR